ncbi:endolytic transglycosylase MltG [Demequina muriae]|uniref:Endolytic murein transglycosylase n=1 Tax=Demequina muriae TaxID=3051664 RepID=A0ABT8GIL9_9MICO|nr:endolytic transglycosylase MltG [Demequina sp. EGI L300058]MDN4481265.1 endolytic transglycosylase MltG [Demequina sp. EGI L300058]
MSTAREQLAAIQHRGATTYAGTALASSHGPVTRRVRRDRTVRAGVATLAGVGVVGAGAFGALQLRGADAVAPMGTLSPSVSGDSAPTPEPSTALPEGGIIEVEPGERADAIIERLAEAYDTDVETARESVALKLPPEADGNPEGWLAPGEHATWTEDGSASAGTLTGQASSMVLGTEVALHGVPREQWQEVLIIASLVEQETSRTEDMPQVARVIRNRVDAGMRLELDSTVRYALGEDGDESPFTTAEDREADSPYNTYVHAGLPPTPIATPSREALEAAIDPADGEWLFFVTINPDTGETRFAEDFEGHQDNVMLLQEWAQENG